METKMLRWTAGVTRLDRIHTDTIRQRFGVAPIAEKLLEARFQWSLGSAQGTPEATLARYVALELKDGWCAP
ncbi:unnamed protein product [Heligmosomoides polygyrus]|uniref:Transposase n=1 Tax=Heligmosomoides polygyrus TaxID=6339 RepID=A0A183F4N8_HELPZ|nr:unnamed protein product [Heligmosomoides polygyrus]